MNRLRDLRLEKGWNMSETAKHFQLPYTTYVSYEKGERTPSFDLVCRMAEYYDVSVTFLMGMADIRGSFPKPDEDNYYDPWDSPAPKEGEADKIMAFMHSLPKDRLRGILVALGAPEEVLAELDQQ